MKILSVTKRNGILSALSIDKWKVVVEHEGQIRKMNCWAGTERKAEVDSLLFSIDQKLQTDAFGTHIMGGHVDGIEVAENAINGVSTKITEQKIVINVQQNQKKNVVQSATRIRYGK